VAGQKIGVLQSKSISVQYTPQEFSDKDNQLPKLA